MKNTRSNILKTTALAALALCGAAAWAETKIVIDGSTTVGPISKAFADFYKEGHPNVNITISESGSGNGVKSLMNKACDIANMSRFMKDAEFKSCVDKGIRPVAHVVAFDGLAVIVNPKNPVKALSMQQISDIYTGKISNWKELGGEDAKIVIVSRDTNSGTYETFNELVLKKAPVAKDAIAYVGLGFADDSVKTLSVNGILPNAKSVSSGKYPIARPLFMFTDGYPKMGSDVYNFVTIHLSKEGREIVSDLGYIPVCE